LLGVRHSIAQAQAQLSGQNRQWQPGLQSARMTRVGAAIQEPGENQAQSSLHLLIWIENDTARPVDKTHGQRYAEFSAPPFGVLP
jgi:hypothetical protein